MNQRMFYLFQMDAQWTGVVAFNGSRNVIVAGRMVCVDWI